MDGISRVAGVGPSITLCGKSYQVRGKTAEYYASMEAEIIKTRGSNPFEILVEASANIRSDPEILRQIVRELADRCKSWRFVDDIDVFDFGRTSRGRSLHLWLCIRDNEGAPDRDECHVQYMREIASRGRTAQAWQDEIDKAISQASGEDQLGNSTGQSGSDQAGPSTGDKSTAA